MKALKKNRILAETHPEIAKQWHPTKNGTRTPSDVTYTSRKRVWWICPKGHEWRSGVSSRTYLRSGCPTCSHKVRGEERTRETIRKKGSLAENHPAIAKQWHPTKNGDLSPSDVASGTRKKVWWVCDKGHEWDAMVYSRALGGTGCRYCRAGTSKLEIRFYCELKEIFQGVKWRERISGLESDIYLSGHKICIEIDGYPWHLGREEKDRQKGERFLDRGLRLYRVRDERLQRISQTDTIYKNREKHISIIKRLLKTLLRNLSFPDEVEENIEEYLGFDKLRNVKEFLIVSLVRSSAPSL